MSTVEFYGETFQLRDEVSEFALMEFAEAAADGEDGDTMQGAASLLRLIRECLTEDGWPKFRGLARENRAAAKDLMVVIEAAFSDAAERPTGRPSDSSDGPVVTGLKPESNSDGKDLERLLPGRPDLQLAILRQRNVQSA